MKSCIYCLLFFACAHVSSQNMEYQLSNRKPTVECRSKHVWDAGYALRVYHQNGSYFGMIHSITIAGYDHEYYKGPVAMKAITKRKNPIRGFEITDNQSDPRKSIEIKVFSNGFGRIKKLEGKFIPPVQFSFVDLDCIYAPDFFEAIQ